MDMHQAAIRPHMRTLGVNWGGASAEAVKIAWRKAARQAHPDVAGETSTEDMARINAAYAALKNGVPKKKSLAPGPRHTLKLCEMLVDSKIQPTG